MRSGAVVFLLGILFLAELPTLPDPLIVQFLPLLAFLALFSRPLRLSALCLVGCVWALFRAELVLSARLPGALEGFDLKVDGVVASVPWRATNRTRFLFDVQELLLPANKGWSGGPIRLDWYQTAPELMPGDRWQLTVRLKRPRGLMNPGTFDYERWLFQQRISATGYVRPNGENRRLGAERAYPIERLRQRLGAAIDLALRDAPYRGVVKALAIGERSAISEQQWRLLRATGTSHLMAISGLHIGLVAAMAFWLAKRCWAHGVLPVVAIPAPQAGALAAVAAACVYALLAGLSIPTRRALVMVGVSMAGILLRRNLAPTLSLAWALALVLIVDPFSVLAMGFWLSFAAVAAILFGMTGYLLKGRVWWQWGRVQVVVAIGMLPLTLVFFQEQSLVAPLANVVAVPWVGFLVVPVVLLGTGLLMAHPALGEPLLGLGERGMALLWMLLDNLAALDLSVLAPQRPPLWTALAGCVGVALLLAPRGFPGRWLGIGWLLPLFCLPPARPGVGELWFTLLDVGQGLSAVVQTREHVLVYDTGPRFSSGFDAGRSVLVPFLRSQGIRRVDRLVLSHEDSDHAGGLASLLADISVGSILGNSTGKPGERVPLPPCYRGQHWRWDDIEFHLLHPPRGEATGRNNESCVLRVVGPGGSVLIPGDIEQHAEHTLLERRRALLNADILIAPHHGSRTSSTQAFLNAVRPRYAVFSVGYRNQFGMPHREVMERYQRHGIRVYDSARYGAISFVIGPTRGIIGPRLYRIDAGRFWNAGTSDLQVGQEK